MSRKYAARADLALAGNALVWGATFVMVKEALRNISPILFLAVRFSVAAAALLILFRGRIGFQRPWREFGAGAAAGAILFSGYAFQTIGLQFTTPSKSAFITGMTIPLVPLVGSLVYRTKPRLAELLGVVLATLGMGLLTWQSGAITAGRGDLLTLACALAFAVHIVWIGHFSGAIGFELLSFVQVVTAASLGCATFWWAETPAVRWSAGVAAAIGVTGLLATAAAFTIQAWAQQYTTPTRTALIYALEPVFAWITSYILTGETLSRRATAGAALILLGILSVEMKRTSVRQHPSQ